MQRISSIINRVKAVAGISRDYQLAELFGISSGDFATRKKKGTLIFSILKWAISEDQDLNFIFYGTEGRPPSDESLLSAIKILQTDGKVSTSFRKSIEAYKVFIEDD